MRPVITKREHTCAICYGKIEKGSLAIVGIETAYRHGMFHYFKPKLRRVKRRVYFHIICALLRGLVNLELLERYGWRVNSNNNQRIERREVNYHSSKMSGFMPSSRLELQQGLVYATHSPKDFALGLSSLKDLIALNLKALDTTLAKKVFKYYHNSSTRLRRVVSLR